MFAYMITHHRWVFVVFLLLPLSVVFGESASQPVTALCHSVCGAAARPTPPCLPTDTRPIPPQHYIAETFLYARNMLQFWQRKRSTKKHEAKVQEIRRQVRVRVLLAMNDDRDTRGRKAKPTACTLPARLKTPHVVRLDLAA